MPEIYDIFATDELADSNQGVLGYDQSPKILEQGRIMQKKAHSDFLEAMDSSQQ